MVLAAAGGHTLVLVEIGALVLVLGVLARFADRVEISPIPLYLVVGLVLGQVGDEPLSFSREVVEIGAQIGLVLLLFMLGLEYTGEDLGSSLRSSLPAGVLDLALNFGPGLLAGLALGWSPLSSLLLGGVTYISSSGVIAKVVADLKRLGNRETPAVLSILVLEDLAMAVYLPVVAVLLADTALAEGLVLIVVALVAVTLALMVVLRHGNTVSRVLASRSDEVLLLTVLGSCCWSQGGPRDFSFRRPSEPSWPESWSPDRSQSERGRCSRLCGTCSRPRFSSFSDSTSTRRRYRRCCWWRSRSPWLQQPPRS